MTGLLESWLAMHCTWAPGLTTAELEAAEHRYGLVFPPDLRAVLQAGLPSGGRWHNWRDPASVAEALAQPWEGMRFDIEHSAFWLPEFGPRPNELEETLRIARSHYDRAPRLIPIYGHRYIPETPLQAGNPVLSVVQTDIIPYGSDLQDWIRNEFSPEEKQVPADTAVQLGLWDTIMMTD